ncbi:integrase core domain-containing protein [Clostridium algidicarnis]|uniref:integrase core domain-containing protein n=1 Tax=Clostridium algidicarnis TaxID=37659 RepID=UPI003FD8459F
MIEVLWQVSHLQNHYNIKNIKNLDELTNDYIFRYYHHKRPHSSLGGLTPFEKRYL